MMMRDVLGFATCLACAGLLYALFVLALLP
jgi:hypothetical protein